MYGVMGYTLLDTFIIMMTTMYSMMITMMTMNAQFYFIWALMTVVFQVGAEYVVNHNYIFHHHRRRHVDGGGANKTYDTGTGPPG